MRTPPPAAELQLPSRRRPVPTNTKLRTRPVGSRIYVAGLLLIPGLVIGGSMAAGWWATTCQPATAAIGAETAEGAVVPLDPADVKGSMTIQQVVDAFPKVTAAQILTQFGAPPTTPVTTQLKEVAKVGNGNDVEDLRTWLQTRMAP
jgi:hypothetical protein